MVDDNGNLVEPTLEKIKMVDEWEQGLYEMMGGDPFEKTQKIEQLLRISAYDFFQMRENHRVETETIKALYKEAERKAKK